MSRAPSEPGPPTPTGQPGEGLAEAIAEVVEHAETATLIVKVVTAARRNRASLLKMNVPPNMYHGAGSPSVAIGSA